MPVIEPPLTVQTWVGAVGCCATVTATSLPPGTFIANMNAPSAVTSSWCPRPSAKERPVPTRPLTVPPTMNV